MLIDVLTRLSADTGLSADQKRNTLLQLLQTSAREMHKELECTKIYREITLAVPVDKLVSLPSFIGELRGTRMHTNELPFNRDSIGSPRYVTNTLEYKFKNWRDLGDSPVQVLPEEIGQITLSCDSVEDTTVSVLIGGESPGSSFVEESVLMNAVSKTTTRLFGPMIFSIACASKDRLYDITIKDVIGNELAILGNNQQKTRYKIIDVSQVFWTLDTSAGESLIDVLYKLPAYNLTRDSDSFYAGDDFDEAWYNMAMFFFLKPLQNRLQDAMTHRAAALDFVRSAKDSTEDGIIKKLSFGRNRFYGLFRKYRYYPGSVTNVDHNIQP